MVCVNSTVVKAETQDPSDTKEMVCVNSTAVKAETQDLPSVLINEAVVADAPIDTSDISDSELSDGDDTDDHACAGGDPASKLKAEMYHFSGERMRWHLVGLTQQLCQPLLPALVNSHFPATPPIHHFQSLGSCIMILPAHQLVPIL